MPKTTWLKFDTFELLFCGLMITGLYGALVFGGSAFDVLGNALRIVVSFTSYRAARYFMASPLADAFIKRLSIWSVASSFLSISLIYTAFLVFRLPVYLSVATEIVLIGIAFVLAYPVKNRGLWVAALSGLVIIGGRRGSMVALFCLLLFYAYHLWTVGKFKRSSLANSGTAVCLILVFSYLAVQVVGPQTFYNLLPSALTSRFASIGIGSAADFSATSATSGRDEEVQLVLDAFTQNPIGMLTGFGFGSTITLQSGDEVSTIHVSPLALSWVYGFPLGLTIFAYAFYLPLKAHAKYRHLMGPRDFALILIALSFIFSSFSIMIFLQTPIMWVALGAIKTFVDKAEGRIPQPIPIVPSPLPLGAGTT